jgi:hypothetical protein
MAGQTLVRRSASVSAGRWNGRAGRRRGGARHVRDGDLDAQVQVAGRCAGVDDRDVAVAAEESARPARRAHCGGQPDALGLGRR